MNGTINSYYSLHQHASLVENGHLKLRYSECKQITYYKCLFYELFNDYRRFISRFRS